MIAKSPSIISSAIDTGYPLDLIKQKISCPLTTYGAVSFLIQVLLPIFTKTIAMKPNRFLFPVIFILLTSACFGQVKIGDPTGAPDPKAILELKDTTRGLLLPRMTQAHMNAISTPPDGLLIYNTTSNSIYQYNQPSLQWKPIMADSSEWVYQTGSGKLYLRRALNTGDSMYYNIGTKKMIFADTRFLTGTSGIPFNLDEGNSDKHVFKTTASLFPRSMPNLNSANIYSVYEADADTAAINNPFQASYSGIGVAAVINTSATQKVSDLIGVNIASGNGGQDTVLTVYGIVNNAYTRGINYTETLMGQANFISAGGSNTANIGEIYGAFNTISYVSPATSTRRILGNLYGSFTNISSTLNNKVDGAAYGVFLTNVRASSSNNNFALYTNKGINRLADSTLITDGFTVKPRTVLDINATSAMIIPVGNTAQRPLTLYTGMLRYNTDNAAPEAYNGTAWISLKNPVITSTALLDPPLIANNTTVPVNYTFTGAVSGNTVTISPASPLPSGIVIAWATVTAVNQVTIGFANFSGGGVDLPAQNFYIKVVQ